MIRLPSLGGLLCFMIILLKRRSSSRRLRSFNNEESNTTTSTHATQNFSLFQYEIVEIFSLCSSTVFVGWRKVVENCSSFSCRFTTAVGRVYECFSFFSLNTKRPPSEKLNFLLLLILLYNILSSFSSIKWKFFAFLCWRAHGTRRRNFAL